MRIVTYEADYLAKDWTKENINVKYNIDYVDRKATIIRNTSQGNRPVYDTNTFIQQNLIRVESISFYNE